MSSALGRVLIAQSVISCFISDQLIFIETLCVPKREKRRRQEQMRANRDWLISGARELERDYRFNPVTKTAFEGASLPFQSIKS